MENDKNARVDTLEFIKQTMDAVANQAILDSAEKSQGEYGVALIKLFNEYGIYGMRIYEFMTAFETIQRMYGVEGEKDA